MLKTMALLLSILLLFTSCSFIGPSLPGSDGNGMSKSTGFKIESLDNISDTMFEEILNAIKDRDSDAIKALFSKTALEEDANIDAALEYLFNLFDGEIISWERDNLSAGESSRKNGYSRMIRSWYTVHTAETRYRFILLNYDKNTIDPDMQGLYTLRGINAEYAKTQWGDWVEMEIPGVYMPEE